MSSCSNGKVRRCQPLLGTWVEITAGGQGQASLGEAVSAAFNRVQVLQRQMSIYDSTSDLSRVNAEAHTRPVKVNHETFAVLQRAMKLARSTSGAFDFTVAPVLAKWGVIPPHLRRKYPGDWRDVELLPRCRVGFARALAIDLGGIAKGFAVDAAVAALRERQVPWGVVNAGGDLRVFGKEPTRVHVRHPVWPQVSAHTMEVRDAAVATSSPCFSQRRWRRMKVSHLVNGRTRRPLTGAISVSVCAPECWRADALTKVVLGAPEVAERLLREYEATAMILTA